MYKALKKSILKGFIGLCILAPLALTNILPAIAENTLQKPNLSAIKQELLADPLFLSHLRDKLSANTMDDDHIRDIIKQYLLKNPEILLDIEQALIEQRSGSAKNRSPEANAKIIKSNLEQIFNSPDDIILGNPNGDVTIVEFYDYNCGYCKNSFEEIEKLLEKDKNIRFVMKDLPILGDDSLKAHIIAQIMRQKYPEKYQEFHVKMLKLEAKATEESALEVAQLLGTNIDDIKSLISSNANTEKLIDNAEIASKLGINFTPCFVIGDQLIMGAADEDTLESLVAQIRHGVQRD